jgi:hypothetical protein
MRTARTLETEMMKVLLGSVGTATKKMSQVLGAFGLLDFLSCYGRFSLGARLETYEPIISTSLVFFFYVGPR